MREGKMLKIQLALLCAVLVTGLLVGCAEEDKDGPGAGEEKTIYEGENGGRWQENCTISRKDTGGQMDIHINAAISVPEIKSMSVVEVEGMACEVKTVGEDEDELGEGGERLVPTGDTRQHVVENVLDGEAYAYTGAKEYNRPGKRGKKPLEDGEFTGSTFIGKRGDVDYTVDFTGTRIFVRPEDWREAAPEEIRESGKYVWALAAFDEEPTEEIQKNQCKLTEAEAGKMAEDFLEQLGFGGQMLTDTKDCFWTVVDTLELEQDWEADAYVKNGYVFRFSPGDGQQDFLLSGTEDDYYRPLAGLSRDEDNEFVREHRYLDYSMNSCCEIYVSDEGVVQADLKAPVKVVSKTENVQLLSMERIKEMFLDTMEEYINGYMEQAGRMGYSQITALDTILLDEMTLVYYRMGGEDSRHFSYVPAWRLANWTRALPPLMLINAIDGSLIPIWEG